MKTFLIHALVAIENDASGVIAFDNQYTVEADDYESASLIAADRVVAEATLRGFTASNDVEILDARYA